MSQSVLAHKKGVPLKYIRFTMFYKSQADDMIHYVFYTDIRCCDIVTFDCFSSVFMFTNDFNEGHIVIRDHTVVDTGHEYIAH